MVHVYSTCNILLMPATTVCLLKTLLKVEFWVANKCILSLVIKERKEGRKALSHHTSPLSLCFQVKVMGSEIEIEMGFSPEILKKS